MASEEIARGTLNLEVNVKLQEINQKVDQISKTIEDRLNSSTQRAGKSVESNLGKAVKSVTQTIGALGVVGAASLAAIATKSILAGKEFNILQQQVRAGLTAILGTTKAAEGLLKQVNLLNDTSPFPRSAFLSATQQLVGFGVSAERVVPILDAVQNAVAGIGGNANDIQLFTRAFAQIQSQGRLTGDVLFSLGSKGVDAAKIIGDQMGKTGQQIKDEVTKGAIGADQAIDLLTKGLSEKFEGAVENVAKSFIGASDRVTARLRDIGADITRAFINPIGGGAAVDGFNNIADALSNIRKNVISQLLPAIQTFADLFVRVTALVRDFTSGLSVGEIQKFFGVIQALVPVLALFAQKFVAGIASSLPMINRFAGALGGPIVSIGILIATVPELRKAFFDVINALTPLVNSLLPVFDSALKSIQGTLVVIIPILSAIVGAITVLSGVLTPVVNLLQRMGIAGPILALLVTRFAATRIAGTAAFTQISLSLGLMIAKLREAGLATDVMGNKLSTMGKAAQAGGILVGGIGAALKSIITPANAAIALFTVISGRLAQGKANADALKVSITEGFDLNKPLEFGMALDKANNALAEQEKRLAGVNSRILSFTPTSLVDIANAKAGINAVQQTIDKLNEITKIQTSLGSAVLQGLAGTELAEQFDIADVIREATAAGIDFTNLSWDKVLTTADGLIAKFKEMPTAAEESTAKMVESLTKNADALDKIRAAADKLKASEKTLADLRRVSAQELKDNVTQAEFGLAAARRAVGAAADTLVQAELSLTQAKRGVADADQRLIDLNTQRNTLLADTTAGTRELAEAERGLASTKQTLLDIDQRREAILRDQADLAEDGGDKIAAADRAILRAKIALNNATREEQELLKGVNDEQVTSVDLAGLTVDQIKTKLAGVRAQLAAQRKSTKEVKSADQIADEALTVGLNKLDAEQAYKDAVEARGDLEIDQGIQKRENEEALIGLGIDRESTLARQYTQQVEIGKLRAGDTQHARDIKALDDQIVIATDAITTSAIALNTAEREVLAAIDLQKTSVLAIRDAEREVDSATFNIRQHSWDIRDAQAQIRIDSIAVRDAVATQTSDQKAINRALVDRIGLNATILAQNPALLGQVARDLLGPAGLIKTRGGNVENVGRINALTDILANHPDQLLAFLRELGLAFADGGVVQSETFARIGEAGREVVLPLTRPARLAELLGDSQVLHPVLAALGRISLPSPKGKTGTITTAAHTPSPRLNTGGTRTNVITRRGDGPATYDQIQDLIKAVNENRAEIRVEAPITVQAAGDEDLLIRKISKQVERNVLKNINKR